MDNTRKPTQKELDQQAREEEKARRGNPKNLVERNPQQMDNDQHPETGKFPQEDQKGPAWEVEQKSKIQQKSQTEENKTSDKNTDKPESKGSNEEVDETVGTTL